ncbi:hypothetical protein [Thalassotalea sp. Y01]|uniref:hypothetical protein n=1 Tax=Thalassotalea sp. Y01 TaxID=2729613 RepID=UPI00145E42E8|nr:hypothetical protein [Thalassotalea sp. Y01]NMP17182.1 hypothetical protein [Thalassotalea sp. Y01]
MKSLITLLLCFSLAACMTTYRISADEENKPLANNEGYFGLVFNTLDPLKNIQFKNKETGEEFYEGRVEKGIHQLTMRVPEGEYCLIGFDVYNWRVDYKEQGFCTYVEAGEVNYFGEFLVRDPVTVANDNYPRYVHLLAKQFPQLCQNYIGEECQL